MCSSPLLRGRYQGPRVALVRNSAPRLWSLEPSFETLACAGRHPGNLQIGRVEDLLMRATPNLTELPEDLRLVGFTTVGA